MGPEIKLGRYEVSAKTRRTQSPYYTNSPLWARIMAKVWWVLLVGCHDIQIRDTKTGKYVRE